MVGHATTRLGRLLSSVIREKDDLLRNVEGDETESSLLFGITQPIKLNLAVVIYKKNLPIDGFVMDHPVYSNLNNGNYKLDIGYGHMEPGSFAFPATFPITFTGGIVIAATELIYEDNF